MVKPLRARKIITSEPAIEETITTEPATVESSRAEQTVNVEPQVIEQAATTQSTPPSFKDFQNTSPLPFQDEGYGCGITLDSMIVTPRVPTLVKDATDVGTKGENEAPEETTQEFVASSSISEKVGFMKQSGVTLIYVAEAIEKEHATLK